MKNFFGFFFGWIFGIGLGIYVQKNYSNDVVISNLATIEIDSSVTATYNRLIIRDSSVQFLRDGRTLVFRNPYEISVTIDTIIRH